MTFGTNTPSSLRINSGSTHIKKKKKKKVRRSTDTQKLEYRKKSVLEKGVCSSFRNVKGTIIKLHNVSPGKMR